MTLLSRIRDFAATAHVNYFVQKSLLGVGIRNRIFHTRCECAKNSCAAVPLHLIEKDLLLKPRYKVKMECCTNNSHAVCQIRVKFQVKSDTLHPSCMGVLQHRKYRRSAMPISYIYFIIQRRYFNTDLLKKYRYL